MKTKLFKLSSRWPSILNQIAQDFFQSQADFTFSVHLISQEAIRWLNLNYRQKNHSTAVLSFPIRQQIIAQKTSISIKGKQDLGDIFICQEVAKREHWPVENLIVHGFLHLVGLTHENLRQEKKWAKIEKDILKKLALQNGFKKIS